ncbi:MAG: N-acetylmuramoyl-L-alanine amidase, partial [Candidatus Peribacteraceae bacterium]|nr:N-acetylmuramoyl-L-alanine amidase [Candidatus Peribacteraceae bacterium]
MRLPLCIIGWAMPCALLFSSAYGELHTFSEPIDALSIGLHGQAAHAQVSAMEHGYWTQWQTLEIDDDAQPDSTHTELLLFDAPVTTVRIRVAAAQYTLHPLRISGEPPSYEVAALSAAGKPLIYSRRQWGADEDLLINNGKTQQKDTDFSEYTTNGNGQSSVREQQCLQWQKDYPAEFVVERTQETDAQGRTYRWPQGYSADVKVLVVHHTAMKVTGDARTGHERMRALYQYHTESRGWGDIGYHYVIDETGQIFEGRAGGQYVIGGHVYCSNTGTLGISLMGNFDEERPTQSQVKALQWLLKTLADDYGVNLSQKTTFHGISMYPVIGHRNLVATACPGYYLYEVLNQIRTNAATGNTDTPVRFPSLTRKAVTDTVQRISVTGPTLTAVGSTDISGLPGGQTRISLLYRPGNVAGKRGNRVADVIRSNPRIGIWQNTGDREIRVRSELILPRNVNKGETLILTLKLQLPRDPGTYTLQVGDVRYTLTATGRRTRTPEALPLPQTGQPAAQPQQSIVRPRPTVTSTAEDSDTTESTTSIRIRLGYEGDTATLSSARGLVLEGDTTSRTSLELRKDGTQCAAYAAGRLLRRGTLRIDSRDDVTIISSWQKNTNRFRGTIECRVIEGALVLINEVPMEDYMAGLAEEPDTEPFEKQRAFAIAARSYATHYTESANRKFPGMPYDGDDSPARFQMYGGVVFEEKNPAWVRAVRDTAGIVLLKGGQVVKAAYFSSDDGRTRSPEENGWRGFPFAEV